MNQAEGELLCFLLDSSLTLHPLFLAAGEELGDEALRLVGPGEPHERLGFELDRVVQRKGIAFDHHAHRFCRGPAEARWRCERGALLRGESLEFLLAPFQAEGRDFWERTGCVVRE